MLKRVALLLIVSLLTVCALVAAANQEQPKAQVQQAPAGLHIVVRPTTGAPLVIHLHGASGEVHIWVVETPAGEQPQAQQDQEKKRLDAIKKLLPADKPKP